MRFLLGKRFALIPRVRKAATKKKPLPKDEAAAVYL
jgi:hypothetical protein